MSDPSDVAAICAALAAPFAGSEIKWKPGAVSGNRALAICYVDARVVQDRLDEVLGVAGWQDDYTVLDDGSVLCRLRVRLGGEWLTKVDVGGPSEQPDDGDKRKAAFSDALKRAAVKFGVGRHLYRAPVQWVDYDAQKRQFVRPPQLPAAAAPARKTAVQPAAAAAPAAAPDPRAAQAPAARPAAAAPPAPAPSRPADRPPLSDEQFHRLQATIQPKVPQADLPAFRVALGVVNFTTLPADLYDLVRLVVEVARAPILMAEEVSKRFGNRSVLDLAPAEVAAAVRGLEQTAARKTAAAK
jgi:hypothetical protein